MITGSTIIIRIMLEATVFVVLLNHRSQSCEQNNDNYTYPEMSDISIFELLWCFLNIDE